MTSATLQWSSRRAVSIGGGKGSNSEPPMLTVFLHSTKLKLSQFDFCRAVLLLFGSWSEVTKQLLFCPRAGWCLEGSTTLSFSEPFRAAPASPALTEEGRSSSTRYRHTEEIRQSLFILHQLLSEQPQGSGCVHGLHGLVQHLELQVCHILCENSSCSFFTLVPTKPSKEMGEN